MSGSCVAFGQTSHAACLRNKHQTQRIRNKKHVLHWHSVRLDGLEAQDV